MYTQKLKTDIYLFEVFFLDVNALPKMYICIITLFQFSKLPQSSTAGHTAEDMKANHLQASTGNPSEDIDMTDVDLPENSNEVNLVTSIICCFTFPA